MFEHLVAPAGPYAAIRVVPSTGSTNADLVAAAPTTPDRTVLIAEAQSAGQGRRGRSWVSSGGGLYLSVLLRPDVPPARLPWITLLTGLALVRATAWAGVTATLKWPNDLLIDDAKVAGVLAETTTGAVVVGVGLNTAPLPPGVQPGAGGLPPTSLAEAGARVTDRFAVAEVLLAELAALESEWRAAHGLPGALLAEYREHSATIGRDVRVELTGRELLGAAEDVLEDGTLVVRDREGTAHTVSAGDVVHLRVR
ncbi:biotin--[acetyl-CoA-carboxylase] ligase [Actinosynnema pretiosum]|uniref:biotin--[biotin carboxyl-carrier protein] ligase n=1 Tax=Actinosynnema pretiosum TaxID=42197 RepID=A0A290ZDZ5_9PSEU|nr:biotin--[acetyl-CoA-carboxylase] ligase [Actinosynnema pretiosum]ATE57241.1 biotin--[acetyl-CoA-carboxylase] ligase [Actinosynnema pretiosum]